MLIACPECERKVSDRAKSCPDCGFPVSEHVAEQAAVAHREAVAASRERIGEIDCPRCDARGFVNETAIDEDGQPRRLFGWCVDCKHSGRVHQCRDLDGYYAVSYAALEEFLSGVIGLDGAPGVVHVGTEPITEHRYPQPGKLWDGDD